PVCPSSSLREPTRYQTIVATTALSCNSLVSTVRPFARTVFCTSRVMNDFSWVSVQAASAVAISVVIMALSNQFPECCSQMRPESVRYENSRGLKEASQTEWLCGVSAATACEFALIWLDSDSGVAAGLSLTPWKKHDAR